MLQNCAQVWLCERIFDRKDGNSAGQKPHVAVFIETTRSMLLLSSSYDIVLVVYQSVLCYETYEVEQSISVPLLTYDSAHIRSCA